MAYAAPTYEQRLTPIKSVFLENFAVGEVKFISRILGQNELPVETVWLTSITTGAVQEQKHIHENVKGFLEK